MFQSAFILLLLVYIFFLTVASVGFYKHASHIVILKFFAHIFQNGFKKLLTDIGVRDLYNRYGILYWTCIKPFSYHNNYCDIPSIIACKLSSRSKWITNSRYTIRMALVSVQFSLLEHILFFALFNLVNYFYLVCVNLIYNKTLLVIRRKLAF